MGKPKGQKIGFGQMSSVLIENDCVPLEKVMTRVPNGPEHGEP